MFHLYLSDSLKLRAPGFADSLKSVLTAHHITINWLQGTKDIWARDYMPIKVSEGEYVSFRYEPWYLKGYEELRTNRFEIPLLKELNITYSDLTIDGGNIELSDHYALLTDRVLEENPNRTKRSIIAELENLLQREVILIKAYSKSEDMTGHIDGMMRFVDERTILVNAIPNDYKYHQDDLEMLSKKGFTIEELPYMEDPFNKSKKIKAEERISASGIYVNYLFLDRYILFPIFETENFHQANEKAIQKMKLLFPKQQIISIPFDEIAKRGGLMNCISWNN